MRDSHEQRDGLMTHSRLTLALLLTLAACSPSGNQPQEPLDAQRVALPSESLPPELPPKQPDGAVWQSVGADKIAFGVPGAAPLLTITCLHEGTPSAQLRFARYTRAEAGAKALFALEGNGHVARLALDVVRAGDPGEWQGTASAFDEAVEAIKGRAAVTATLPGGGSLKLPVSDLPGTLLDQCRGSAVLPTAVPSTVPGT